MVRRPMSEAAMRNERVWLRARLCDLRADITRYGDKADDVALGGVEAYLKQAHEAVEDAIGVLNKVIDKGRDTNAAEGSA